MTDLFFFVVQLLMCACQMVCEALGFDAAQMTNDNLSIHVEE